MKFRGVEISTEEEFVSASSKGELDSNNLVLVESPHEKYTPHKLTKLQSNENLAKVGTGHQNNCIMDICLMVPNKIELPSADTTSTLHM